LPPSHLPSAADDGIDFPPPRPKRANKAAATAKASVQAPRAAAAPLAAPAEAAPSPATANLDRVTSIVAAAASAAAAAAAAVVVAAAGEKIRDQLKVGVEGKGWG